MLELAIVILLVSILMGVFLNRALYYRELAEKSAAANEKAMALFESRLNSLEKAAEIDRAEEVAEKTLPLPPLSLADRLRALRES